MNILLVSPLPPPNGGIATWTEQYLDNSKGINDIYIVDTALIGERASHRGGRMKFVSEIKRFCGIIRRYCSLLHSKKIDIIHINSSCSKSGIIRDALCVALAGKHPVVFHCHCNVRDQLRGKLALALGNYVYKRAKCIFVLNRDSFEFVQNMTKNRVLMLPNSINEKYIVDSVETSARLKNVIYVGHVKKKKGIEEIIKTASTEKDIVFHLVGPVSKEIEALPFTDNVVFYGKMEHDDAVDMMKKADAFVFPSYTEGFSMVMLEAMASGLPIIASNVGANAEMIESCGGVIISPKSSAELTSALEDIRPKEVREKMAEWNLKKVKIAYGNKTVFKRMQEVYREICI